MKKKNFIALVFGVVGGLLFSIGLCMCLLPQWDAFQPGVIVTAMGLALLLALVFILRKGKPAKAINWKVVGKVAYGVFGALVLGAGMSMILVFEMMLPGIAVGVVGILLLLGLIPMCIGLK